ncbi:ATP-binding protein [Streptomyces sp. NPDC005122]
MIRTDTSPVITHDMAGGLVQHRCVSLNSHDRPVELAREHVRSALQGSATAVRIDDAVLVADELVANALKHTERGPTCMNLNVYQDAAVMWIHDDSPDIQAVQVRSTAWSPLVDLPESGRGLCLVDALASTWFVWPTQHGKAVVAVFNLDGDGATSPDQLP